MKNKVTGLELSKKLKELGVKQDSEFYHAGDKRIVANEVKRLFPVHCSAFLSCELGEMLPAIVKGYRLSAIKDDDNTWYVEYSDSINTMSNETLDEAFFQADTEAEARGKMVEYLLENNLIEL